jgi:flagellar motility protein MotE (MotC chaperone)
VKNTANSPIPTKSPRGALWFITALLIASGLLRLADPEIALAEEVANLATRATSTSENSETSQREICSTSESTSSMLESIRVRQTQLDERENRMADRMQALKVAELKLKENTAALILAEEQLAATLTIADAAAEKDLMRLTLVYESMKPKSSAGLFGAMAPEFAAGFLGRMRADAAAEIMSKLTPEKAYTISLILAGRNALAPSE